MSYRERYEQWLNSPALSQEEKAELQSIANDEKEIESRFFAPCLLYTSDAADD